MMNPAHSNIAVKELRDMYIAMRDKLESRILDFREKWESGTEEELFAELVFCLLTPQSRAKLCWSAVERICSAELLFEGRDDEILTCLDGVRFKWTKARNIIAARNVFMNNNRLNIRNMLSAFKNIVTAREWLVSNIRGMGYKESSHFLRNIGRGENFAILDRHIIKNLSAMAVIDNIPHNLTKARYIEIEEKMREFARGIAIPMAHLDLLLWCKETGVIFK